MSATCTRSTTLSVESVRSYMTMTIRSGSADIELGRTGRDRDWSQTWNCDLVWCFEHDVSSSIDFITLFSCDHESAYWSLGLA